MSQVFIVESHLLIAHSLTLLLFFFKHKYYLNIKNK